MKITNLTFNGIVDYKIGDTFNVYSYSNSHIIGIFGVWVPKNYPNNPPNRHYGFRIKTLK